MIKLIFLFLSLFFVTNVYSQSLATPDKLWGKLFEDVQLNRVFADNKTFVDAVPRFQPSLILSKYNAEKTKPGFHLKNFVEQHFELPVEPVVKVEKGLALTKHLENLWEVLLRNADTANRYSSLLPLPEPYIVPGGRFREIYYWDSYFTMLGLAETNRYDLIEHMLNNFKWLIDNYGHIPNGNRNYYLSRSQPPYFALMIELLKEKKGDAIYNTYYTAMQKEYSYWMKGEAALKGKQAAARVVKMPDGSILNRYWDDKNAPREESYAEDVALAKIYAHKDKRAYTNLRAGAESGIDFSSRWFADTANLNTIETTNIVPVDLNCLLYTYEVTLSKAAATAGSKTKATYYQSRAEKRKKAILKYFWDESRQAFFDYHLLQNKLTGRWVISSTMPLFTNVATTRQAASMNKHIHSIFLKPGGLLTTPYKTGQQWDAPNGWAPLQYIAVKGLLNYGFNEEAKGIAEKWMQLNEKVFAATGKMMEKYNVENTSLESGGGEYPTQDGFGWSNGVYLKFFSLFGK